MYFGSYFTPAKGANIAVSVSVCPVSVRLHISKIIQISGYFSIHINCGHGAVLL